MAYASLVLKCAKCGEEFKWSKKYPSRTAADSAEEWASGGWMICTDCYKKQKNAEREAEKERKKAEVNQFLDTFEITLPELKGTPRQVDWAISIRQEAIYGISSLLLRNLDPQKPDHKKLAQLMATSITDAKVWIDNRQRLDGAEYGRDMYTQLIKIINNNVKLSDEF